MPTCWAFSSTKSIENRVKNCCVVPENTFKICVKPPTFNQSYKICKIMLKIVS